MLCRNRFQDQADSVREEGSEAGDGGVRDQEIRARGERFRYGPLWSSRSLPVARLDFEAKPKMSE